MGPIIWKEVVSIILWVIWTEISCRIVWGKEQVVVDLHDGGIFLVSLGVSIVIDLGVLVFPSSFTVLGQMICCILDYFSLHRISVYLCLLMDLLVHFKNKLTILIKQIAIILLFTSIRPWKQWKIFALLLLFFLIFLAILGHFLSGG